MKREKEEYMKSGKAKELAKATADGSAEKREEGKRKWKEHVFAVSPKRVRGKDQADVSGQKTTRTQTEKMTPEGVGNQQMEGAMPLQPTEDVPSQSVRKINNKVPKLKEEQKQQPVQEQRPETQKKPEGEPKMPKSKAKGKAKSKSGEKTKQDADEANVVPKMRPSLEEDMIFRLGFLEQCNASEAAGMVPEAPVG